MRIEKDSMGPVNIPADALWGAQTQRAVENFPISGQHFSTEFTRAMGQVKKACTQANLELGLLDNDIGKAILQASDELISGQLDAHFPIDVFQTGSGTSTNMNANEVLANRAIQIMGGIVGSRSPVHPNDHVNLSQSSNDIFPTVIHVAASLLIRDKLIPSLASLEKVLHEKAVAFDHIIKTGRTHLQDATPIRLGQEFTGYQTQAKKSLRRAEQALDALKELPLGGTAVGTGLNRHLNFPQKAIHHLNKASHSNFIEASDHFEANASRDSLVEASGLLKTIAVSMTKIANDIRWLGSGPRAGLGELKLPAVQPGSSIMPGKVNPVMAEALIMVAAQVIGLDSVITLGGLGGYFELNLMMPLFAYNLLNSIEWLSNGITAFTNRCVKDIQADEVQCHSHLENNLSIVTGLAPIIGYDQAAEISKEAYLQGKSIREVALERKIMSVEELDKALDAYRMTEPDKS